MSDLEAKRPPINAEALAAIRERCDKATPGPWYATEAVEWQPHKGPWYDVGAGITTDPENTSYAGCDVVEGGHQDEQGGAVGVLKNADAAFIAAARTDVPDLLAEVERLREAQRWRDPRTEPLTVSEQVEVLVQVNGERFVDVAEWGMDAWEGCQGNCWWPNEVIGWRFIPEMEPAPEEVSE